MADNPLQTDVGAAIIRTVAPYATAWAVAYLAKNGLALNSDEVNGAVVAVGGSLWYSVVRALEVKWPKAGWLLGMPKQPTYDAGPPKGA